MAKRTGSPKKQPLWQFLYWGTQLSGVSLEVALFVLLGYWGDRYWGTRPTLLVIGGVTGLVISMSHLWLLVRSMDRADRSRSG
ncbi:AtpZ/AtpI family protein [Planctomicrobium piriforme]|uniref:Putative F0F1-ATPase subunit Ca2+/Mg2+ transporter n=1 Tax=Planctomicrobium piriforme TaxID=1576369 RepID=A0A1I3S4X0_9PLAN|nr:AtpZ/AtpI family protein [Planctomicrobium piriforme]SFJ53678.1 Putative F0F1-ATPase subunit Ca2+/Mg2+ transporter [Planctomicrobium piriforme]